jgi:hypothetical protein
MRIEVIANHSVEENIMDEFRAEGVAKYYTKLNNVHGVGSSGPRMGDAIWPEENFVLIVWCDQAEALGIERALKRVKQRFPTEGVKLFGLHEVSSNTALLTGKLTPLIEYKGENGECYADAEVTGVDDGSEFDNHAAIGGAPSGVVAPGAAAAPHITLSDGLGLTI